MVRQETEALHVVFEFHDDISGRTIREIVRPPGHAERTERDDLWEIATQRRADGNDEWTEDAHCWSEEKPEVTPIDE